MKKIVYALCACLLIVQAGACSALAEESTAGKTLILYYSRTGTTKLACEILAKELGADMLEIKDGTDRSGGWGFFTGALNAMFSMQTSITPEHPDLASYGRVIVASPVWAGKLAAAPRTLLALNRLEGKKIGLFMTTNVLEKESSREKSKALAAKSGGTVVGDWQVAVTEKIEGKKTEKTPERITQETIALVSEIKAAFEK